MGSSSTEAPELLPKILPDGCEPVTPHDVSRGLHVEQMTLVAAHLLLTNFSVLICSLLSLWSSLLII